MDNRFYFYEVFLDSCVTQYLTLYYNTEYTRTDKLADQMLSDRLQSICELVVNCRSHYESLTPDKNGILSHLYYLNELLTKHETDNTIVQMLGMIVACYDECVNASSTDT